MNDELDDFLSRKPAEAEVAPAPEAPPVEAAAPEPEAKEPDAPEQEPDDGEHEAEPADAAGIRKAMLAERAQRKDWKEKAIRAEEREAELRRQLEDFRKAPPAPQEQRQPPAPIDPSIDPQGFVSRVQEVMLNERLNTSELMLRRELGAEKVEAAIAEFKQAAASDPSLFPKLYAQPDPYAWMAKQVEVMRLQKEIGENPAAYRERLIAEERAKWEAERSPPAAPPVSPAAGLAPSLANARPSAPRSAAGFSGPTPMSAILGG